MPQNSNNNHLKSLADSDAPIAKAIRQNYIEDYWVSAAYANLASDIDTIIVHTQADKLTNELISTISERASHTAKTVQMPATPRQEPHLMSQKSWIFPVVLLAVVLLGVIRHSTTNFITELFQSIFSDTKWIKTSESLKLQNRTPATIMFMVYHLILPLIVYEIFIDQRISVGIDNDLIVYLLIFIAGLALFGLRYGSYALLGYIFNTNQSTSHFLNASFIFTFIMGIILLPFALVIPFANPLWYSILFRVAISLFVLFYIWMLLRGIKLISDSFLSIFYMFLYLCALEIIPVIWLFKLLTGDGI